MFPVRVIEKILHRQPGAEVLTDVPAEANVCRHPARGAIRVDPGIASIAIAQPILSAGESHEGLDPEAWYRPVEKADLPVQGGDPIPRHGPAVPKLLLRPRVGESAVGLQVI